MIPSRDGTGLWALIDLVGAFAVTRLFVWCVEDLIRRFLRPDPIPAPKKGKADES